MASKSDLQDWIYEALKDAGGSARLVDVAKHIWANHESELRRSADLFYTWQYDMRWAANQLRRNHRMKDAELSPKGVWQVL